MTGDVLLGLEVTAVEVSGIQQHLGKEKPNRCHMFSTNKGL